MPSFVTLTMEPASPSPFHFVRACPFAGAICSCGSVLAQSPVTKALGAHIRKYKNGASSEHCYVGREGGNVKVSRASVASILNGRYRQIAERHLALIHDDDSLKRMYKHFLLSPKTMTWCEQCFKGYKDGKHAGKNRAHTSSHALAITQLLPVKAGPGRSPSRFVCLDSPDWEKSLCAGYLLILGEVKAEAVLRERIASAALHHPPVAAANPQMPDALLLGVDDDSPSMDINSLLDAPLAKVEIHPAIDAIEDFDLDISQEANQMAMSHMQGLTSGDAAHRKLLEFVKEIGYDGFARRHFNGNHDKMGLYLSLLTRPCQTGIVWEHNLAFASGQFYERVCSQLPAVSAQLRSQIMMVGTSGGSNLAARLSELLSDRLSGATHFGSDDADSPDFGYGDIEDLAGLLKEVQSAVNAQASSFASTASHKRLCLLAPSTLARYKSTFVRFVVSFARRLEADKNEWWIAKCLPSLSGAAEVDSTSHLACVLKLVITALELGQNDNYEGMVKEHYSLTRIFVLAVGIDRSSMGTDIPATNEFFSPILRYQAPYQIHQACSHLFFSFRIAFIGGMLLACRPEYSPLRGLLKDAYVLCRSQAIMSLAEMAAIAKKFEKHMPTGLKPTSVLFEDDGRELVFVTPKPNGAGNIKLGKSQIQAGTLALVADVRSELDSFLRQVVPATNIGSQLNIDLSDEEHMSRFLAMMFDGECAILKAGTHNVFEEDIASRRFNGTLASIKVYASTIHVTYREPPVAPAGDHGNDQLLEITSSDISTSISSFLAESLGCLERSPNHALLKLLDVTSSDILSKIAALHTMVNRGMPRENEIFFQSCGETNAFTTTQGYSDIVPSGFGDFFDRLLVHFDSVKYNGSADQRDCPFMWMPIEVDRLLAIYLSIVRCSSTLLLGKAAEKNLFPIPMRQEQVRETICQAPTRFAMEIVLSATPVRCRPYFGLQNEIQRHRETALGLPEGSLVSGVWRMKKNAISNVIYQGKLPDHKVSEEAAAGNNHNATTQSQHYSTQVLSDEARCGKVPLSALQMGAQLDSRTHEWFGFSRTNVESPVNARARVARPWRRLRLFSNQQSFGLVKLTWDANFSEIQPFQRIVATEAASGLRDSLFRYPCGNGKTFVPLARIGYGLACSFVRGCQSVADPLVRQRLFARLKKIKHLQRASRSMPDDDSASHGDSLEVSSATSIDEDASELCDKLLQDDDVLALLAFAMEDDAPPPVSCVALVIIPNYVVVKSSVCDINESQLVWAHSWERGLSHKRVVRSLSDRHIDTAIDSHNADVFDVIVMTAARSAMSKYTTVISAACRKGVVGEIVAEEAHSYTNHAEYRWNTGRVGQIPRHGIPLFASTGSIQKEMISPLALTLTASWAQSECSSHAAKSRALCSGNDAERRNFWRLWILAKGVHHPPCIVPPQVRHSVLHTNHAGSALFVAVARMIVPLVLCENPRWRAVHVFVSSRNDVEEMAEAIRAEAAKTGAGVPLVATLKGKSTREETGEFVAQFVKGDARFASSTTTCAEGLNNKKCDAVLLLGTLFDLETLLQMSTRCGRSGQQSESIFVLSKGAVARRLHQESRSDLEYRHTTLLMSGVDVDNITVRSALSFEAMLPYLSTTVCRRRELCNAFDGVGSKMNLLNGDSSFCCDNCNPEWSQWLHEVWQHACSASSLSTQEDGRMTTANASSGHVGGGDTVDGGDHTGGGEIAGGIIDVSNATCGSSAIDGCDTAGADDAADDGDTATLTCDADAGVDDVCAHVTPPDMTPPDMADDEEADQVLNLCEGQGSQGGSKPLQSPPAPPCGIVATDSLMPQKPVRKVHNPYLKQTVKSTSSSARIDSSSTFSSVTSGGGRSRGSGGPRGSQFLDASILPVVDDNSGIEELMLRVCGPCSPPRQAFCMDATRRSTHKKLSPRKRASKRPSKSRGSGLPRQSVRQRDERAAPSDRSSWSNAHEMAATGARTRSTMEGSLVNFLFAQGNNCSCVWHDVSTPRHPMSEVRDALNDKACRSKFSDFIGFRKMSGNSSMKVDRGTRIIQESGVPCNRCGDYFYNSCKGGDGSSRSGHCLGRIGEALGPMLCDAICGRCGVSKVLVTGHTGKHECGGDRTWGLAIWALRNPDGYACVARRYRLLQGSVDFLGNLPVFPPMVPFSFDRPDTITKERKSAWTVAMRFLGSNVDVNLAFWESVRIACRQLG